MLSTNLVKLPWWNWMLEQFLLFSFFFFFCECLGIQFFNSLTCDLRDAMPRQRLLTLFTHKWLTEHYATPEVTHALFPTQPFSVIPHTSVDYHQVFRPILYFQPIAEWLTTLPQPTLFTVSATGLREHFLLSGVF